MNYVGPDKSYVLLYCIYALSMVFESLRSSINIAFKGEKSIEFAMVNH